MKRIAFLLIIAVALMSFCSCNILFAILERPRGETGMEDQTDQYDSMLERVEDWHKVVTVEPIVTEHEILDMIDGSTATIPITAELYRQFYDYSDDEITYNVSHTKTHEAYMNLITKHCRCVVPYASLCDDLYNGDEQKTVDIIFATYPSEDELSEAAANAVELEFEPIAMDGFVFITHKNNPIESLTVQQVRDIYSGKITNWKDIGGEDLPIKAYQRNPNSGSQTAMEEFVMQGEELMEAPEARVAQVMSMLVDVIAEYENGSASIGYTYKYYINNLYKSPDIKIINIEGIAPDNENLLNASYPFTTSYYAVIRKDEPEGTPARNLRDYLLTDEGQSVVEMAGYCGVR